MGILGILGNKGNDLLKIVNLISRLMTRIDRLEKRTRDTENRVESIVKKMKCEESSALSVRMNNIEKVQAAQGGTLEGYLKKFGSLWDAITKLHQCKLTRPEGTETLNFGSWMGDVENRLESCENRIDGLWPKIETEATLFGPPVKEDYVAPETNVRQDPQKRTRVVEKGKVYVSAIRMALRKKGIKPGFGIIQKTIDALGIPRMYKSGHEGDGSYQMLTCEDRERVQRAVGNLYR